MEKTADGHLSICPKCGATASQFGGGLVVCPKCGEIHNE